MKTSTGQHQQEEGLEIVDFVGDPIDIYGLSHPIKTDIDELRDNRMLIRLKVPVFIGQSEMSLPQERILNFLGGKVKIQIAVEHTTVTLAICVIKEGYKQLELDWDC